MDDDIDLSNLIIKNDQGNPSELQPTQAEVQLQAKDELFYEQGGRVPITPIKKQ